MGAPLEQPTPEQAQSFLVKLTQDAQRFAPFTPEPYEHPSIVEFSLTDFDESVESDASMGALGEELSFDGLSDCRLDPLKALIRNAIR